MAETPLIQATPEVSAPPVENSAPATAETSTGSQEIQSGLESGTDATKTVDNGALFAEQLSNVNTAGDIESTFSNMTTNTVDGSSNNAIPVSNNENASGGNAVDNNLKTSNPDWDGFLKSVTQPTTESTNPTPAAESSVSSIDNTTNTPAAGESSQTTTSQTEDVGGDPRLREMGMSLQDQLRAQARMEGLSPEQQQQELTRMQTELQSGNVLGKEAAKNKYGSSSQTENTGASQSTEAPQEHSSKQEDIVDVDPATLREATAEDIQKNQEGLDRMKSTSEDTKTIDGQVKEAPNDNTKSETKADNPQSQEDITIIQKSQEQVNQEEIQRRIAAREELNGYLDRNPDLAIIMTSLFRGDFNEMSAFLKVMEQRLLEGQKKKELPLWAKILKAIAQFMIAVGVTTLDSVKK